MKAVSARAMNGFASGVSRELAGQASESELPADAAGQQTGRNRRGRLRGPVHAMIKAIFSKPLRLQIGERTVTFNSVADFEFSLVGRTEVPAAKLTKLMALEPDKLKREAMSIREAETRFAETLSRTVEVPGSVGEIMHDLNLQLFSQDHDWRSIIEALARQGAQYDEYKQVALVKYMQYLGSRQEVLKALYRQKGESAGRAGSATAEPASAALSKATAIFDLNQLPEAQPSKSTMARLPRGEAVDIHLSKGEQLELLLARHRFKIVRGVKEYFVVDDAGASHRLKTGVNTIGRQEGSEVPVDPAHGSVSRRHLIIEVTPDLGMRLTDLSAHGTSVPAAYLRGTDGPSGEA